MAADGAMQSIAALTLPPAVTGSAQVVLSSVSGLCITLPELAFLLHSKHVGVGTFYIVTGNKTYMAL